MTKSTFILAVFMLFIGLGGGYWLSTTGSPDAVVNETADRVPLFYRNPMNPSITSPVPSKDSMGMDYIPVYSDSNSVKDEVGTVLIDPVAVQNIGVRTMVVKKGPLSRTIRTVGRVAFDEERMVRLHPKVEGWIEEIRIDKTGEKVSADDILLSIYAPKLVSTQQEYLLALNNLEALQDSPFEDIRQGAKSLVKSSKQRLEMLDVAPHQIQELEKTRDIKKSLHIHSPAAGSVINIGARQGQYVTPKTELYMIVDLNQVWVYADIYDYELPWIKEGDRVEISLASVPGKTFGGSLAYIYPYAESKTRTTKVRLVFDNRDLLLRPDMFANVTIYSDTQKQVTIVPSEAIIRSGDRTQVFVVIAPGKFEPRLVTLGIESNGQVAIVQGVNAGEEVVTSAQFLVDSESKLREATAKMMRSDITPNQSVTSKTTINHLQKDSGEMDNSNMDHSKMDHSQMVDSTKDHSQMVDSTKDHSKMVNNTKDHSSGKISRDNEQGQSSTSSGVAMEHKHD